MDNPLLYKWLRELRQQCRFGQQAFDQLRASLLALDAEKTFLFADSVLAHAVRISRLLWPDKPEARARGEALRAELKVTDQSLLRLAGTRSKLEHPDQHFEEWLRGLEHSEYMETNIMPRGTIGDYKPDTFHRDLDPETHTFRFRGDEWDLRALSREMKQVEAAVDGWMKTHKPW